MITRRGAGEKCQRAQPTEGSAMDAEPTRGDTLNDLLEMRDDMVIRINLLDHSDIAVAVEYRRSLHQALEDLNRSVEFRTGKLRKPLNIARWSPDC
jgi:hypothetical protein